jgi:hypothetical protein
VIKAMLDSKGKHQFEAILLQKNDMQVPLNQKLKDGVTEGIRALV